MIKDIEQILGNEAESSGPISVKPFRKRCCTCLGRISLIE